MFMDLRRSILFLLAVVFLASSFFIVYYLLGSDFYTNSDLFWIGWLSGVFGCMLFVALIGLIFVLVRQFATMKNRLIGLMILSMAGLAVIYFVRGPFSLNSDIWWYGATAGFFGCLAAVFLSLTVLIFYRLFNKRQILKGQIGIKRLTS
jgi:hypothetical protein